jgi:hypothetical protein
MHCMSMFSSWLHILEGLYYEMKYVEGLKETLSKKQQICTTHILNNIEVRTSQKVNHNLVHTIFSQNQK